MSEPAAIRLVDVAKTYRRQGGAAVAAVRGVDLVVAPGEFVALMGPSGCGKSTLLNLIAGVDVPDRGEVHVLGQRIDRLSEAERAALRLRRIGFVFQRFHLLPVLTAAENVELVLAEAGVPRAERQRRVAELLAYVGLAERARHRPPQLSGGEQQRVAIARALANGPALILADEPTGELDRATGAEILRLFRQVHREGTTLLVVTHDPDVAACAERVVRMRDGRILPDDSAVGVG